LAIIRVLEGAELLLEVGSEIPVSAGVGQSEFQFGEDSKSGLKLRSLYALQL
jgi:hypothetical protein